jgi:LysR family carnitine catabolism transcriptional activator
MIKLEHLRSFLTVAQHGALAQAADILGRTPSAVSMTLKQLEDALGGPLFVGERKSTLTPLGRTVAEEATRALRAHDEALKNISQFAKGTAGIVRVAAVPSVAASLLPMAVQLFDAPDMRLELRDTDSTAVAQAVASGSVDFGIASPSRAAETLQSEPLLRDPLHIVVPRDHPLTRAQGPLQWADLVPYAFIGNGLCDMVTVPELQALAGRAQLFIRNVTGLHVFIERGFGISVLPQMSLGIYPGLVGLAVDDNRMHRPLTLLQRRDEVLSPGAARFIAAIRAAIVTLGLS